MDLNKMEEIAGQFNKGSFATIDENGMPDVRGWELQFIKNGKVYFTTSNSKSVYRELMKNPKAAFLCTGRGYNIRISGEAVFSKDPAEIAEVYRTMDPSVRNMYPTPEANGFQVFYFAHGTVKYAKGYEAYQQFAF